MIFKRFSKTVIFTVSILSCIIIQSCGSKNADFSTKIEANPQESSFPTPASPNFNRATNTMLYGSLQEAVRKTMETYPLDPDFRLLGSVSVLVCSFDGLEELGMGYYDSKTGIYHSCIEEKGPYIQALSFLNELFRKNRFTPVNQINQISQNQDTESDFRTTEANVSKTVQEDSWKAIQAATPQEFNRAIKQMQIDAKTYGIDALDARYVKEAARKSH
ncbi:MAG: hypothetical protein J5857_10460 [Treponema sp.]|nr:hypothetical protein [Treponema sp.]